MAARAPPPDPYGALGAGPSAGAAELRRRYRRLVRTYHPDRQSADAPAEAVEECVRKFIEIDQAWKILGHEETKKEYDLLRLDDHSFSLSCRCGGKYRVSKDEAEEVTLISCDTCSLIVELLHRS
ncbi:dnaJ homolog subfamily C member 24 isoform X2 [Equus asinus]|uniref:dnaJ homolog subfamily C member 24 isoform X2 n=1 Tax=Equus quagga TaxID=89248 RepID=UPI001EE3859A|nr:dnaJ homolog subfamily C member 24 isoform X2 [Equus quagga]